MNKAQEKLYMEHLCQKRQNCKKNHKKRTNLHKKEYKTNTNRRSCENCASVFVRP